MFAPQPKRKERTSRYITSQELFSNVVQVGDCQEWSGLRDKDGYGVVSFKNKRTRVHRLAWMFHTGSMPHPTVLIMHSCDNPPCINLEHLSAGTNRDNMADMVRKGRSLTGDKNPSRTHRDKMPRGEFNRNSKLTEAEVLEARALKEQRKSIAFIARKLNVSWGTIKYAVSGVTWKHVKPVPRKHTTPWGWKDPISGREVCDESTAGKREYKRRIQVMLDRQGGKCILCRRRLFASEATFEHEMGRGHGGGHRDDRITDASGKEINGAAHGSCNTQKGSTRGYGANQRGNE